jgi:CheY-like chemotaxis protein
VRVPIAAKKPQQEERGVGERILLVDDENDIRRTLSRLLIESGYAVETASNGADAIALIARQRPDLLLLDYAMPGMTGLDVAKTVRQTYPRLPILFMSGFADTKMLEVEMPAALLLRKPFGNDELHEAIRRSLSEVR